MPRTLPAELSTAMDSGVFKAYIAIGKRNYTGGIVTSYTTLITNILYYKYDGLELTVKWASPNLPETDGVTPGNKYYIERGATIAGVNYTIKSASLRFDTYSCEKQVITAKFSLFSPDEKPNPVTGYDSYTNVLTAMNPNAAIGGITNFRATPENANHWGYRFFPSGKNVTTASYASFLPLIRQKYLLMAVDDSNDSQDDAIQYYHLTSQTPIEDQFNTVTGAQNSPTHGIAYSPELGLFAACMDQGARRIQTSPDGITWTTQNLTTGSYTAICWSPELGLFVAVGNNEIVAYSPDGINWTTQTLGTGFYNFGGVAWSPQLGLFIAGGIKTYSSPDGITWTLRNTDVSKSIACICWSPALALFVAMAGNDSVKTSPDGINWTTTSTGLGTWSPTSICWSPELALFVAVAESKTTAPSRIATSTNGTAWTSRTDPDAKSWQAVAWSSLYSRFIAVASDGTHRLMTSENGTAWTLITTATDSNYYAICFSEELKIFVVTGYDFGASQIFLRTKIIAADYDEIIQGDIQINSTGKSRQYVWRDEVQSIHTQGDGPIHNLGYLESTDLPPYDTNNSTYAILKKGIHLKYKSGDIVKLAINANQYATYHIIATEILDPKAEIGWATQIELVERFANTNGGAMPSTIERVAAYTPLVTTNFDGNLDETVNNLQALAEKVDNMPIPPSPIDATTATNDFLIGAQVAGIWTWVKNTLAQTITVLRTSLDSVYAPIAKGVTNGDSHDHNGGDGAQIDHGGQAGLGDDDHTQYVKKSTLEGRHPLPSGLFVDHAPFTAAGLLAYAQTIDKAMTLQSWTLSCRVVDTSDSSNYWTIAIATDAGVDLATLDTKTVNTTNWKNITASMSPVALSPTTHVILYLYIKTKTGAPGNLYLAGPGWEISI